MKLLLLALCVVILILVLIVFNQKRKIDILKLRFSSDSNGVNGKDLFENISKSKTLYKDLLIELHPDRFTTDENKKNSANLLILRIAEHKSSYRELISIAKEAKINFDLSEKLINKYPEISE